MVQVVSFCLIQPAFNPRPVNVQFVVDTVVLEQNFFQYLISPVSIILPVLNTQVMYVPSTLYNLSNLLLCRCPIVPGDLSVRIAYSLTEYVTSENNPRSNLPHQQYLKQTFCPIFHASLHLMVLFYSHINIHSL